MQKPEGVGLMLCSPPLWCVPKATRQYATSYLKIRAHTDDYHRPERSPIVHWRTCGALSKVPPAATFHKYVVFIGPNDRLLMSSSAGKSHDCSRYICPPFNVAETALNKYSCNTGVEMHRKRHREILTATHLVKEEKTTANLSPSENITTIAAPTPKTKKEKKQARKMAVNSIRVSAAEIFTEADYAFASQALYGRTTWGKSGSPKVEKNVGQDSKETSASTDNPAEDGRNKFKLESHSRSLQNTTRRDSSGPRSVASDSLVGVDPKIFERLGVKLAGKDKWSKKRKEHLKKLATIIAEDLEVTEREDREAEIRKAGFLRFVNKRIITNLDELHEHFSWSTGEITKRDRIQKRASDEGEKGEERRVLEEN